MKKFNFTLRIKGRTYSVIYYQDNHKYCFKKDDKVIVSERDLQKAYSMLERKLILIDPPKEKGLMYG